MSKSSRYVLRILSKIHDEQMLIETHVFYYDSLKTELADYACMHMCTFYIIALSHWHFVYSPSAYYQLSYWAVTVIHCKASFSWKLISIAYPLDCVYVYFKIYHACVTMGASMNNGEYIFLGPLIPCVLFESFNADHCTRVPQFLARKRWQLQFTASYQCASKN